jgi:5-methylthioadenosine/S-adenosylhomocysteine deaminase
MKLLIKNGLIVQHSKHFFKGDILVENGLIRNLSHLSLAADGAQVIDATNQFVVPGFVQAHTHLVQTLFRGEADDLSLISWLQKKVWPMEAAHTAPSIRASGLLGVLEMQLNGTTSILDMATVKHTQDLLEAVEETGIRYWGGKCLMDRPGSPLAESTESALDETVDLMTEWKNRHPLIHYAICPRFVVSCSEKLLKEVAELQRKHKCIVHVHASESKEEIKMVKKLTKMSNVAYLHKLKLLNSRTAIVHGVHLTDGELASMAKTRTPLVHCPSSNMKLASGLAPITKYLQKKIKIGLGGDGAPCNNCMDPFKEMHLAAILQKPVFGPEALPARTAFDLATMGGARVLGMEKEIGSIEIGKRADIVTIDRSHPSVVTVDDPYSALVYSCNGRDVRNVVINGKIIVKEREHQLLDAAKVKRVAIEEKQKLLQRAKIPGLGSIRIS